MRALVVEKDARQGFESGEKGGLVAMSYVLRNLLTLTKAVGQRSIDRLGLYTFRPIVMRRLQRPS